MKNLTETYGVTMSLSETAKYLHTALPRLRAQAEKGNLPFVFETTYPGEEKRTFKVVTGRLEKYLNGELDKEVGQ